MEKQTTITAPGRRSSLILDVALEMRRKGYLGFFHDLWKQHGDFSRLEIRGNSMFLAVHPEHVHHISITNRQNYDKLHSYDVVRKLLLGDGLVTSTGDLWRRQRRLMAPFFTRRGIEAYFPVMLQDGRAMVRRWETLAGSGQAVEFSAEMTRVTAAIILRSMFSSENDEDLGRMKDAVEIMIAFASRFETNPFRPPLWVPTQTNRRYLAARALVHSFIRRVLQRRHDLPVEEWPDDLLSKMMLARDEETGSAMSETLLRDESITIFFAGHETTARTLTFLWYALSQNLLVLERLQAEVDEVLGDHDPTLADLNRMPYSLQVIKETMRLYPPAPFYVRDAVGEDVIDGYPVPAGARILLSPYLTHRHPDFWEQPERFDPDRWLPEQEAERHPYAWHPFAAGQRICLGNSFSLQESHLLTAMLARRFYPKSLPGHQLELDMAGTLVSKNGVPLLIECR